MNPQQSGLLIQPLLYIFDIFFELYDLLTCLLFIEYRLVIEIVYQLKLFNNLISSHPLLSILFNVKVYLFLTQTNINLLHLERLTASVTMMPELDKGVF